MAKFWFTTLALLVSAGLWAAPAMASTSDVEDVGNIQRGGAEDNAAGTTLGSKGLVFTTDGFSLRATSRVQFRFTHQQEVGNGENGTNGRNFNNFSVPRAKTTLSGHIFQKEFGYALRLNWAGGSLIEQAYFRWAFNPYLNIQAGQDKLPWNWEEYSDSGRMQFVDRSYVNEVFNQGYAKGLTIDGQVGDDTPWLKYWVGIYNGVLAGPSDFRNSDMGNPAEAFSDGLVDAEMMLNMRLETHPLGEVERGMNDMRDEAEHDKILFAIGLGVNWFSSGYDAATAFSNSGSRDDTAGGAPASGRFRTNQDTWAITLDGHFRWMGLSVDAAFYYRHTNFHNRGSNRFRPQGANGISDLTDVAFTFEVAYFIIPQEFNVGIRFNMLDADDFWGGGATNKIGGVRPDTTEIGLSVNYYIHGENLKLTFDLSHVAQQVNFPAGDDMLGVYNTPPARRLSGTLGSSSADYNNLWIIRLQLQWIF